MSEQNIKELRISTIPSTLSYRNISPQKTMAINMDQDNSMIYLFGKTGINLPVLLLYGEAKKRHHQSSARP